MITESEKKFAVDLLKDSRQQVGECAGKITHLIAEYELDNTEVDTVIKLLLFINESSNNNYKE